MSPVDDLADACPVAIGIALLFRACVNRLEALYTLHRMALFATSVPSRNEMGRPA